VMRMVDLILKKRNGEELTKEEIHFIIDGYTKGEIPDYQISAWTMAVYFQGMTEKETGILTEAIVRSGEQVDLSGIYGHKADKHSTGGVGDTTTLVLAPLVASAGIPVAKMSGRGLGHTGGTIDKLESFSGFKVELNREQFLEQVNRIGVAVIGQSGNLTPADKKLYALRDVTGTVESIPLIASSIMSKKIAAGADSIVLDVKTGSGAFMKDLDKAKELAKAMVNIGKHVGRNTIAIISDMNQPLGYAVGNVLEVKEAIATLKGEGPKDLEELCLTLGSFMLVLSERAQDFEEGYQILKEKIADGSALNKLRELVQAQNGDVNQVDQPDLLPKASYQIEVKSPTSGYVSRIACDQLGTSAMLLGAGRATKEDKIDLAVGLVLNKKIGDPVEKGETLLTLHANSQKNIEQVMNMIIDAYEFSSEKAETPTLIYEVIK
jgi:pyrimidine-nucleoside phosphorylase